MKNLYKLDEKNRFSVPGKFLSSGRIFYLTMGLDGCIFMYPEKEFRKISDRISLFDYSKSGNRKFLRIFFAWSSRIRADSHNRILIPSQLKKKAKIRSKILMIKIGNWFEIWAPALFEKYEKVDRKSYSRLAENLDIKL
ncbi:MAG: hypothetical protein J7L54_00275 [Elusimicrobia bacterium]|nr:hypothetical protein [Elusimicrobiota bacterium]